MQVWKMASQNPTAEFFGKLANQYSVEPASQSNFGEVPPIPRHSTTPELEKEAFSLKVGEISQVVQVGEYYFILMGMGQTTPMVEDIDSVREILEKDLYQKKLMLAMQEMYQSLREDSQIDNFLAGTSQPSRAQREAVRKTQSLSR
jgi:parvulin-like peptidyl-prolyl isomerase